jgi:hypothetical protein
MRTHLWRSIARNCTGGILFLFLTVGLRVFGQIVDPVDPIDPVIGPLVRIISPPNHAVFRAPADVPIFAFVVDAAETTNVAFYANSNFLGYGLNLGVTNHPIGTPIPNVAWDELPAARLTAEYCFVWTNVQPGSYSLTAVAKQRVSPVLTNDYLYRTSLPVNITVLAVPPPPTNTLDVVSIVATDPVAIVGTNSWIWPGQSNPIPAWTNWPPPIATPCTNWGPKEALFTVRRFGSAASALTVNYSISGTASNGVDYAMLPGYVNIAAGEAYGLIPVVPIDHGPPYLTKTVILTLTPSITASPLPSYIIGIPPSAEAVIIHAWPRPLPFLLPDGTFHLNAPGPDGAWFAVESSPDLINWTPVCTNQVVEGSIDFVDANAPATAHLFYKAVPQASAPSQ